MKIDRMTKLALTALVTMLLAAACSGPTGGGPKPGAADGTFVLSLNVTGAGTVLIDEVDLSCRDSCTARVGRDVTVRLVAEPDAGAGFAGWGQACSGLDECTLRMDSDVEVSAMFSNNVLALRFDGDGDGSARIVPPDVTCSDDCGEAFSAPLNASISVTTADGTSVRGWGGACSDAGNGRYCQVHVEGQTDVNLTLVHPPVANDDAYEVQEDGTLTIPAASGVLSNDRDSEGDSLSAELLSQPSKGSVQLSADGSFTYTPRRDENGPDNFTYRARDEFGNLSGSANVSVVIQGVDEPLVPIPLSMTVMEDQTETGTVQASGGEGSLTFSKATDPTHGSASLSGTTATYSPEAHYFGEDAFKFRVEDSSGQSGTATISIDVIPVNDAPSFTLSSSNVESSPGASESLTDFATGISAGPNEGGQTLRFEVVPFGDSDLTFTSSPELDTNGTLTFQIAEGSSGSAQFDVILFDDGGIENGGQNESPSVRFTITAESASSPPSAESGTMSLNEDGSKTKFLQASGGEGSLTYSEETGPSHGSLSISGAEALYTPNANFAGNDQFEFRVTDSSGQWDTAVIAIAVASVNDPPTFGLSASTVTTQPGASESISGFATGIAAGPANESGQALTFVLTSTSGGLEFSTPPAIDPSGTLTFEVAGDGSGSAQFDVVLRDDGGTANGGDDESNPQQFEIVAEEPAAALQAEDASYTLREDHDLEITLSSTGGTGTLRTYGLSTGPTKGQVVPAEGNPVTYTPDSDYSGSDEFEFSVEDEGDGQDHGLISLTVEPVNDAPAFELPDPLVEVPANSGQQTMPEFTTAHSPGAPDETGQALTFHVDAISTGGMTFVSTPTISIEGASGTLAFEVADGHSGEAEFEAVLRDDGGTDNGGVDESERKRFTVRVSTT